MSKTISSRRDFLKITTAGAAGLVFGANPSAHSSPLPAHQSEDKAADRKIKLGVASYSFRQFSRPEAIGMMKKLGTSYVNLKSYHLPMDTPPEQLVIARQEFEEAGLQIIGGGIFHIRENEENKIREIFDYAKTVGIPLLVVSPTRENLPLLENFAVDYNLKVAVHNTGPGAPAFADVKDVIKAVKGMDAHLGLCLDVANAVRTEGDVVQTIIRAGHRLLDVQMKDLKDPTARRSLCPVGNGVMPVVEIFKQLKKMK